MKDYKKKKLIQDEIRSVYMDTGIGLPYLCYKHHCK